MQQYLKVTVTASCVSKFITIILSLDPTTLQLSCGTWILVSSFEPFEGHLAGIRALHFNGHKIISGRLDNTIKVWDWQTWRCIRTFSGHDDGVIGLDVAGNIIASSSIDETI